MIGWVALWIGGTLLAVAVVAAALRLLIDGINDEQPVKVVAAAVLLAIAFGTAIGATTWKRSHRDRCEAIVVETR